MESLSQRLMQLRMKSGVTQRRLGELIGKSEQAYQKYEYGTAEPSAGALLIYAAFFHTSIQYLVTGKETEKKYDEENVTPFSERVKELRKKNHLTQKQAAAELGIRYTAYQAYEYGKSEPNLDHLQQLADLFGVTLDELMGRNEK